MLEERDDDPTAGQTWPIHRAAPTTTAPLVGPPTADGPGGIWPPLPDLCPAGPIADPSPGLGRPGTDQAGVGPADLSASGSDVEGGGGGDCGTVADRQDGAGRRRGERQGSRGKEKKPKKKERKYNGKWMRRNRNDWGGA